MTRIATSAPPTAAAAAKRKKRALRRETQLPVPALMGTSLCTTEVRDKIIQAIRAGAYPNTAAQRAGIAPRTFRAWMQRGRDAEEPFATFLEEVEGAIAEDEYRNVLIVSAAAKHDAKHAEWLLERRHPDKYGRSDRVEFDGSMDQRSVSVNVQATTADTSPDYIAQVVAIALSLNTRNGNIVEPSKVIEMPAPSPTVVVQEDEAT